jgi:hypothetical protein
MHPLNCNQVKIKKFEDNFSLKESMEGEKNNTRIDELLKTNETTAQSRQLKPYY